VGQRTAGLVARARGHRRYYAAVHQQGEAQIWRRRDAECRILARKACEIPFDVPLEFAFSLHGDRLEFAIEGRSILRATDDHYTNGGAGFIVEEGGYLATSFSVAALPQGA